MCPYYIPDRGVPPRRRTLSGVRLKGYLTGYLYAIHFHTTSIFIHALNGLEIKSSIFRPQSDLCVECPSGAL